MKSFLSKLSWYDRAKDLGLSLNVIVVIIALSLVSTITEVLGIGLFLPIFQFMRVNGNMDILTEDSDFWQYVVSIFSFFDLQVSLSLMLLISFILIILRQIFTYIREVYTVRVTKTLAQKQYNCLFGKYMMANTPYQDNIPVGNMANIIFKEVDGAVAATMAPIGLIVSVIVLSGYLSILFLLSWKMTIVSVVIIIFAGAIPKIWIKESLKIGRKLVYANTKTSEFFIDRLKSPRLVRLSGTEDAEINEFFNLTLVQRNYQIISAILRSKTVFVMEPIIIMLSLIFLYFSYTMMKLSLEEIGLYLVVALRLVPATKSIVGQFQAIQNLVGSVEILNKHMVSMTDATERDLGTKVLLGLDQEISYNNLSYYYTKDSNFALNNINIKFKANKTTAIVGPSGSGKSTLIDLLPRLRLPTRGSIQIDGVGINKITLASLRKAISYAPQSPQIFNGTIKEHILYGKVDATDDEVEEAAYLSGAKEFINDLPLGFDTLLGEDACKLSGGQKQRLDLARALVGESPILILDEPTSSLDAESEEIFRRSLLRIRNNTNTTIIVIAHKLSSISSVDKIVVLNQGMVESSGTHLELLNKSDWYTKAWNFQQL